MTQEKRHHSIAGVFVFLVLGLFAVMSMFLVLEGARAYKSTVNMTAEHNNRRVIHAYVRNAVRSEDCAGAVAVKDISGVTVIQIRQDMMVEEASTQSDFYNYIYCYDGMLMSQFLEEGRVFKPEQGEEICQMAECAIRMEGNMLELTLKDHEGNEYQDHIALRCAGAEVDAK